MASPSRLKRLSSPKIAPEVILTHEHELVVLQPVPIPLRTWKRAHALGQVNEIILDAVDRRLSQLEQGNGAKRS
jgi:hypothetical protein